jgi:hypothetical protein
MRKLLFSEQGTDLARTDSIYLECDARPQAEAVAEPVSALEGRNLFGQEGGLVDVKERDEFPVGGALGTDRVSGVDGIDGARGEEAAVRRGNRLLVSHLWVRAVWLALLSLARIVWIAGEWAPRFWRTNRGIYLK